MSAVPFSEALARRVAAVDSLLCIGLDPHRAHLPHPQTAREAEDFCAAIVRSTHMYAACYKPNSAFFEAFGKEGSSALLAVLAVIRECAGDVPIPVILDNKRGDIDTTAQAYALASYEAYGADAVTLSPYMGFDSIKPFITDPFQHKAAFVLCKTSNATSDDFQTLKVNGGEMLFEAVTKRVCQWNDNNPASNNSLGLVVGATDLKALRAVRKIARNEWILCPGVGAQGGDALSVCHAALRDDGSGLLVSVSRGISQASDMGAKAKELCDDINATRREVLASRELSRKTAAPTAQIEQYQSDFISFALQQQVLQFGSFKLKSGRLSPYFFNAGLFCCGFSISELAKYYAIAIKNSGYEFDVIFGPAYKGIPLATSVAAAYYQMYSESKDVCYNRKEAKDHGEGGVLVGAPIAGRRVLIVDDVITAGTAIRESVDILSHAQAVIVSVVVSLDRQERASDDCAESAIQLVERDFGFPVLSIVRLEHLVVFVEGSTDSAYAGQLDIVRQYRAAYGVSYVDKDK